MEVSFSVDHGRLLLINKDPAMPTESKRCCALGVCVCCSIGYFTYGTAVAVGMSTEGAAALGVFVPCLACVLPQRNSRTKEVSCLAVKSYAIICVDKEYAATGPRAITAPKKITMHR